MRIHVFQNVYEANSDAQDGIMLIKAASETAAKLKAVQMYKEEEWPGFEDMTPKAFEDQYAYLGEYEVIE